MQQPMDSVVQTRIMMVGQPRVGKTSLFMTMRGLPFAPRCSSTPGLSCFGGKLWGLDAHTKRFNDDMGMVVPPVSCSVAEFNGLPSSPLREMFLDTPGMYYIVFNMERFVPDEFDEATLGFIGAWLDVASKRPVLLVATHSNSVIFPHYNSIDAKLRVTFDGHPAFKRVVQNGDYCFFMTDPSIEGAADDIINFKNGLSVLFNATLATAKRYKSAQLTTVPVQWTTLLDEIEGANRNVTSRWELEELDGDLEVARALVVLDKEGVVIYRPALLGEAVIVNPIKFLLPRVVAIIRDHGLCNAAEHWELNDRRRHGDDYLALKSEGKLSEHLKRFLWGENEGRKSSDFVTRVMLQFKLLTDCWKHDYHVFGHDNACEEKREHKEIHMPAHEDNSIEGFLNKHNLSQFFPVLDSLGDNMGEIRLLGMLDIDRAAAANNGIPFKLGTLARLKRELLKIQFPSLH